MKANKLLRLIAAAALAFSLTVPVSAAGGSQTTTITAVCQMPEIKVTVPMTGKVYINPQKLPVNLSGSIGTESEEEDTPQIISIPSCIRNDSEVPVEVNVTVTGKVPSNSGISLVNSSTGVAKSTAKKVFMYFQMKPVDSSLVEGVTDNDALSEALDGVAWDSAYSASDHVLVSTTGRTKKNIITLDQADGENSCAAFRLSGECAAKPTTAWKSSDRMNVDVAFTFTPLPREAE